MRKLAILLVFSSVALAQNVRFDAQFPSINSQTAQPFLIANVPPNSPTLAVCHSPANQVPCTNFVTTFNGLGVACSNGAQDTPQPALTSSCQSAGDAQGNIGFWIPAGTYDYTVCISTSCFGPFTVTLNTGGGGVTPPGGSNTQVQFNNSGVFGGITNAGSGAWVLGSGTSQLKWTTDVRDKGIDCTGVTDSTTAVQNMINNAPDYSSFTIPQNCLIKVSGNPAITINQRAGLEFIGQGRSANFCGLAQSGFTYNQTYASGNTIFNINQSQQMIFDKITLLVNGNADIGFNLDQSTSPPITTDVVFSDVCIRNAVSTPNPAFKGFQISKVSQSNVEGIHLIRPWVQCANGVPTSATSNGIGIWFGTSPNQKDEIIEDPKFGNCSIGINFGSAIGSGSDLTVTGGLDSSSWINVVSGGFNTLLSGFRAEGVSGGTNGNVFQELSTAGPYLLYHNDFTGRTVPPIDCPNGCANTTLFNNESDTTFPWWNAHGAKTGVLVGFNNRNSEFDPYDWASSFVLPPAGNQHGSQLPFSAVSSMNFQFTPNANDCGYGACASPLIDLEGEVNAGGQIDPWYLESAPNQNNNLTLNSTFYIVRAPSSTLTPWIALEGTQTGAIYGQTLAPTANNISVNTRGVSGGTTYSYVVVSHGATGTSAGSAPSSTTIGNATLSTSNFIHILMPPQQGCTFFDIYRTACGGVGICNTNPTGKIGSLSCAGIPNEGISTNVIPENFFDDIGLAGDGSTAPATNTSGQIISLVPTGLAPLSIASTTPVANLSLGGGTGTSVNSATYATNTNCASAGGTCGSAASGSVTIAAGGAVVTVVTTAATANSVILITEDMSLGTKLSVTCNATFSDFAVTTRAAGQFTIAAPSNAVTNPYCLNYWIVN